MFRNLLRQLVPSLILTGIVAVVIGIAYPLALFGIGEAAFNSQVNGSLITRDGQVVGAVNIGLLCGLLFCWLRAVTLLALAGRPVLDALSEIRWKTGAPLDTRPRWLTLPPQGTDPDEWTWMRAHMLVGAARLGRYRVQLADTWTYVTAAYFVVWTVIVFLGM